MGNISTNTDLTGQTAMVTGASSGLGVRFAQVLSAAGARVIITARRDEKLAELAQEINGQGGEAHAFALDVTDLDKLPAFFDALREKNLVSLTELSSQEIECKNCGAQIITAKAAQRCPFCDSPVVVHDQSPDIIRPESVLPFQIDNQKAKTMFQDWLKSRCTSVLRSKVICRLRLTLKQFLAL